LQAREVTRQAQEFAENLLVYAARKRRQTELLQRIRDLKSGRAAS